MFLVCVIYPSLYSLYRIYTENIKKFGVLRPRTPPLSLPHLPRDDVSPPTIHRQAACGLAALVVFLSPRVPRLGDGLRGCGGSAWRAGGFQCVLEPPGKQFEDGSGLFTTASDIRAPHLCGLFTGVSGRKGAVRSAKNGRFRETGLLTGEPPRKAASGISKLSLVMTLSIRMMDHEF